MLTKLLVSSQSWELMNHLWEHKTLNEIFYIEELFFLWKWLHSTLVINYYLLIKRFIELQTCSLNHCIEILISTRTNISRLYIWGISDWDVTHLIVSQKPRIEAQSRHGCRAQIVYNNIITDNCLEAESEHLLHKVKTTLTKSLKVPLSTTYIHKPIGFFVPAS